jgi:hypothetical protein
MGLTMVENTVLHNGIVTCVVCHDGSYEQALEWVRLYNMSGTANNWQKVDEDSLSSMPCPDCEGRTHYQFVC